jgi:hypothetical protein
MNPTYFTEIKKQKAVLDVQFPEGDCLVVSLVLPGRGAGGAICETPNHIAARLMVEATHRLADVEESNSYRAAQVLQQAVSNDALALARQKFNLLTGGSE